MPVFEELDAAFLRAPAIPKAPAAARIRLEWSEGKLHVYDEIERDIDSPADLHPAKLLRSLQAPAAFELPSARRIVTLATLAGFCAGLLLAWVLGVL